MRFSAAFAMFEGPQLVPLAKVAEEAGYDSIAVPDSVFFPRNVTADYPYTNDGARFWNERTPFVDPFVAVPAMAAVTERIRFYTNVVKLPLRNPLLVAKQVGSIAALSNNRFTLGVGLSWMPEEFQWTQTSMKTRGARTDEMIEIIRRVTAGDWASFEGKHYNFDDLMMSPNAGTPVEIWVGGHSEPALQRAARTGDGWISVNVTTAEIKTAIDRLRELRGSLDGFAISVLATDAFDVDGYRRLEDMGVTHAQCVPWFFYGGDPNDTEVKRDAMLRFADEVMTKV